MEITFLLNGETMRVTAQPTTTLLDWLRNGRGLCGTKEGCNEGDCGACTVMVTDDSGAKALNACILFLPQLHGKAVRTVEGIAAPDGTLHPVQQAMIDHHGSQCGFCTPGFIAAMATAHLAGRTDHDDVLAGNLCRCTGYAPIIRAAKAAEAQPSPDWMQDTPPAVETVPYAPETLDALAAFYAANPDAVIVAGATDVGLWVTKQLRDLPKPLFLHRCTDLQQVEVTDDALHFGATVTMTAVLDVLRDHHPSYAELVRRYGSDQVRNAATIGGNIANGSPIGDNPPALIALGAQLHLRRGDALREMPIEAFFLDYGKQNRQPGELVTGVTLPRHAPDLRCYKISKRFDQDISAVCGCFNISVVEGVVASARIAFGGMSGIPARATTVEQALIGQPWTQATVDVAAGSFSDDFTPLSDMRASAAYRLEVAQNLLHRYFAQSQGQAANVLEVSA
ncbi:xanthine dehydrogenase small subunit [Yoonia vestfoldensis]|uniref:xanthine dehydrogenase small subunit n=1 Tax=Yoonia vestfoldensis TaxID=245188 RepID=UPI00035D99FF|nr:xanthine dehydrogenase small subunit [Yoonia vestfoldensis]